MEWLFVAAVACIAPLVISIVVAAQFSKLKLAVEDLKRRLAQLEIGRPAPAPVSTATPPPIPRAAAPSPAIPSAQPPPLPQTTTPVPSKPLDWESIVGVKLFAWIGGLAFFLGVVFFVKYAFDNNLITPFMRVFAGTIIGVALVLIGVWTAKRHFRVPAQSLCATGVLILYADIYAAHSFYNLIPLSAATVLMWAATGVALFLATHLSAQSVAWLGVLGGFLTPALLWTNRENPVALFGYIGVLNCGIAAVSALKRWYYLILLAAVGSIVSEFLWTAYFFGPARADTIRAIFLGIEALFVAICLVLNRREGGEIWSRIAAGATGFAALIFPSTIIFGQRNYNADFIFPTVLIAAAGLLALGLTVRSTTAPARKPVDLIMILVGALALAWLAEAVWHDRMVSANAPLMVFMWYVAIFLLFCATPYVCGPEKWWPWFIATIAGPLQFFVAYDLVSQRLLDEWIGLFPLAFALPAAGGIYYLTQRDKISLASADSRLATLGAAIVFFLSTFFAVQFDREWITLGWAIEAVGLILLFRLIPNRRLRTMALIVFAAVFVRLVLNPAVFHYHPRTRVPIFNWYLYAFGLPAICFFLGGRWFGEPREKPYERNGPALLYSLGAIVCFLLLNIEIADYFSIGPTLTFSFYGNFARDMTYTVANALFAFGILIVGIVKNVRALRLAAVGLLGLVLLKLFLHDLDNLSQLYRIAAFISVAVIAIVASFVYQRFLSPGTRQT